MGENQQGASAGVPTSEGRFLKSRQIFEGLEEQVGRRHLWFRCEDGPRWQTCLRGREANPTNRRSKPRQNGVTFELALGEVLGEARRTDLHRVVEASRHSVPSGWLERIYPGLHLTRKTKLPDRSAERKDSLRLWAETECHRQSEE